MYYSRRRTFFNSMEFAEITAITVLLVITGVFIFSRSVDYTVIIEDRSWEFEPVPIPPGPTTLPQPRVKPVSRIPVAMDQEEETDDNELIEIEDIIVPFEEVPPIVFNGIEESKTEDIIAYVGVEEKPLLPVSEREKFSKAIYDNYPQLAKISKTSGKVMLGFVCSENGEPISIRIISEEPGDIGFGEAAVNALSSVKFTPGYQNDKPVKVRMSIPVYFKTK